MISCNPQPRFGHKFRHANKHKRRVKRPEYHVRFILLFLATFKDVLVAYQLKLSEPTSLYVHFKHVEFLL